MAPGFCLRRLAQNVGHDFGSCEGLLLPARSARFLSYFHFSWQAWYIREILRYGKSFCVTGAGHRTL